MLVHIKYVNDPTPTNPMGSLRLTDLSYISVPPQLLPLFKGLENTQVEVATKTYTRRDGSTGLSATSGPGGAAVPLARPPVQRPGQPQVITGGPMGGPVGAPMTPSPPLAEARRMFVSNIVANAMSSGKFTASEIRVLTQAALEGFDMLTKPLAPAKPVPIETWTNNEKTEPPANEPGDPGPQLQ